MIRIGTPAFCTTGMRINEVLTKWLPRGETTIYDALIHLQSERESERK